VVRFFQAVDHPNFTFMLDCGQFAGSKGASAPVPAELRDVDYLESIRQTASLARYVRAKFYNPRGDGSEPFIDYDRVFDILRGVHYDGFVDVVYEPGTGVEGAGEPIGTALPRALAFLKSKIAEGASTPLPAPLRPAGRYVGLETGNYFEDVDPGGVASLAFLEGPAVDRAGNVFFTNIPADQIVKWDPAESKLSVFRENSGGANGLLFDRAGRLLACEGNAGRVTRTDMATGQVIVLADAFNGYPLGGPNDLTSDSEGRVYFTSRLANRNPRQGNVNAVYRIDAPGKVARVLALPDIDMPNGIVTSPDGKRLYLIDADGGEGGARRVRAYDLAADGSVSNERTLYDFYPGRSGDGMCIDAEENLYVAAGLHRRRGSSETLDTRPGIHVISPAGRLLAFVETPEDSITNCTFGGPDLRTLYVTCGKRLLSFRTRVPGKASYRPEA
jgi:gluconolactonase